VFGYGMTSRSSAGTYASCMGRRKDRSCWTPTELRQPLLARSPTMWAKSAKQFPNSGRMLAVGRSVAVRALSGTHNLNPYVD